MNAYWLGALLFIAGTVVFILQNDTQVAVRFMGWQSNQVSLALVIIISTCVGALITFLLESIRAFKNSQKLRKLSKANQRYEQELQQIRAAQGAAGQDASSSTATAPISRERRE